MTLRLMADGEACCEVQHILSGDVLFCSGQSNMDLMIDRVKDAYPGIVENSYNPYIRTFKIAECTNFHGEAEDTQTGEWTEAGPDTLLAFSATAYFLAKSLYEKTGNPVGLIHASLGGSRIASWMSREMLTGFDSLLQLADQYEPDEFRAAALAKNEMQAREWYEDLDKRDRYLQILPKKSVPAQGELIVPGFWNYAELKNFIGSLWLTRCITLTREQAQQESAMLQLGTIVDSDTAWINGVQVGHTDYQYPPRKYNVPDGILREGKNEICLRVIVENGEGRITPGKRIALILGDSEIDLRGLWEYRIGATAQKILPTDFVNWKPTGLYNGMTAPCTRYPVGAIVWYQGESNTHEPESYYALSKRQIEGYRKAWKDETLPYLFVQLPNFTIDLRNEDDWPGLRCEQQRIAADIPDTGMIAAMDLGEDNDLHPHKKQPVGERLARLALHYLYPLGAANWEKEEEYTGPEVDGITASLAEGGGVVLTLSLAHCQNGILLQDGASAAEPEIHDFELVDRSGHRYGCKAAFAGDKITLTCSECLEAPAELLYCCRNTNTGALIYNTEGIPMAAFRRPVPALE